MVMDVIQAGLASVKAAADLARTIGDLKTASEVQAKTIELRSLLADTLDALVQAKSSHVAILDENRDLRDEIARINAFVEEKKRYALAAPWNTGVVYALKESANGGEPAHYLCTHCYENQRKSILNPKSDASDYTLYVCPACHSSIPTGFCGPVAAEFASE